MEEEVEADHNYQRVSGEVDHVVRILLYLLCIHLDKVDNLALTKLFVGGSWEFELFPVYKGDECVGLFGANHLLIVLKMLAYQIEDCLSGN